MPAFEPSVLIYSFVFYYPLFMSYIWIIGGLAYYFHYERRALETVEPMSVIQRFPRVSIIVPCYNEADNAREVIGHLFGMRYPDYEIIAINDGSRDATGAILDELAAKDPRLRVIHQAANQGKAVGLTTAALIASSEYLVCIDGDAILDHDAIPWMLQHFESGPRVGAVTGNPRIRNRSTLIGKLQVGEFSSIVGLLKRAQRTYGRIFTVSGVVVAFRRRALAEVGFWSPDMLTEDIDISWKLQTRYWAVRFEPRALCWILMPETLGGLWKQRLRWAMGGVQVVGKYLWITREWKARRMLPVLAEYFVSVTWAYAMAFVFVMWTVGFVVDLPPRWQISLIPGWHGILIGSTALLQFFVALAVDRHYERNLMRYHFWMIWYPLAYWMLNMFTTVVALPKVILRQAGKRAVWTSPDRGLHQAPGAGDKAA